MGALQCVAYFSGVILSCSTALSLSEGDPPPDTAFDVEFPGSSVGVVLMTQRTRCEGPLLAH